MPPQAPPVALKDHCSVIHDNVLYVYSPEALQSLPLRMGANWSKEAMGISVTGATCVLGGVDGHHSRAALYIVGGSTNSSSIQYPGLQRYLLQEKRWENIEPVAPVTQNRKHHGTAFLNASSSILVYGGSQDGDSNPSSQTFLIETWPPYNVRSFISFAPPVADPTMLTWADNRAAVVGGSPTNNQVFTFGPDDGWADAGVALVQPPPDRSVAQSTLLSLVDGSKVLVVFDMSRSPNTVTRTVLLGPGGQPAQYGETVGNNTKPSRLLRRSDVVLSTFPTYNDSLAPRTVRSGASLAQDSSGLTVISGGNDQEPLLIFSALENRWIDAAELIGEQPQNPSSGSPTSSVSLPTASASSTSAPTVVGSRPRTSTILGAVLGSVLGVAALLIIALLLLRWNKRKRKLQDRRPDVLNDKSHNGSRLSFEDPGTQPFRAAAEPMGHSGAPSARDMTSIGRKGFHLRQPSSMSSRSNIDAQRASNVGGFGPGMFSRKKGALAIPRPIPHAEAAELQERPSTSEARPPLHAATLDPSSSSRKNDPGWSTYFSENTGVDLTSNSNNIAPRASHASSGTAGSYWPDPLAPLANLRSANPGLTDSNGNQLAKMSVRTGSPSIGYAAVDEGSHGVAVTEGIPVKVSSATPLKSSSTDDFLPRRATDNQKGVGSAYLSDQSVGDYSWAFQDSSWSGPPYRLNRPPSSTYTNSIWSPHVTSPKGEDWSKSSVRPVTQWPSEAMSLPAVSTSRPGAWREKHPAVRPARADEVRDYFGSNSRHERQNDMSWLNLNSNSRRSATGNRDGNS